MSPKVMWNKIPLQTLFIKSNRKISGLSNVQKSRTLSRSDLPLLPLEILSNIYALYEFMNHGIHGNVKNSIKIKKTKIFTEKQRWD